MYKAAILLFPALSPLILGTCEEINSSDLDKP